MHCRSDRGGAFDEIPTAAKPASRGRCDHLTAVASGVTLVATGSLLAAALFGAAAPGATDALTFAQSLQLSLAAGPQVATPSTPDKPSGEFSATGTKSTKLGKFTTPWMQYTSAARVRATWEGELCPGMAKLGAPGSDLSAAVALGSSSELYVQASSELSVATAVTKNPLSFPIIVTRGGVKAGSVGTTWFVWVADDNTTYFVLLGSNDSMPSGSDGGLLYAALQSTSPCECDPAAPSPPSSCCRVLSKTDTFVKATTRPVVSLDGPHDLSTNQELKAKVDAAKLCAKASGLRP